MKNHCFVDPPGTWEGVTDLINLPKAFQWNPRLGLARCLFIPVLLGCIAVAIWWIVKTAIQYDQAQKNPYISSTTKTATSRIFPVIAVCPYYAETNLDQLNTDVLPTRKITLPNSDRFNPYTCILINENQTQTANSTLFGGLYGFFEFDSNDTVLEFIINDSQTEFSNLDDLNRAANQAIAVLPLGGQSIVHINYITFTDLDGVKSDYFNYTIDILVPSRRTNPGDSVQGPASSDNFKSENTTLVGFLFSNLGELQLKEQTSLTALTAIGAVGGFITGILLSSLVIIDNLALSMIVAGSRYQTVWTTYQIPDKYGQ